MAGREWAATFFWRSPFANNMRLLAILALFAAALTAAQNLELYFIDVEGGKGVLVRTYFIPSAVLNSRPTRHHPA